MLARQRIPDGNVPAVTILFLLAAVLTHSEAPGPIRPDAVTSRYVQHTDQPSSTGLPLERALREAVRHPAARRDLVIDTECRTTEGHRAVRVYGTGVGIWENRAQFDVDQDRVTRLLEALERHRFLQLRESYGGRTRPPRDGDKQAPRLTCAVRLALGGHERSVMQLQGGEQSPALEALALEIIALGATLGPTGITASSASDGLSKIAGGQLAPEALTLVGHFKPRLGAGWLIELRDGRIRSQVFEAPVGYHPPRILDDARDAVRALAHGLMESGVIALPPRIGLADYTELRTQVLDKAAELHARPFAGLPEPSPQAREAVERAREALAKMHRLVMQRGKPDQRFEM
jgi:hypothetical protein